MPYRQEEVEEYMSELDGEELEEFKEKYDAINADYTERADEIRKQILN